MSANTQVNETRREIVLPAEENQILFVLLGALVEAQIDNDLLKVLCWVLWGDGFATRWARVLVCQILEEENLMVLQDVAAVVGIAIVPAFDRNPPLPGVVPVLPSPHLVCQHIF